MVNRLGRWIRRLPIRTRLALAYLFAVAVILIAFAAFVYFQVQRDLLAQVDAALELAAAQAVTVIDGDEVNLAFENTEDKPASIERLDNYAIYLLDEQRAILDSLGAATSLPPGPPLPGSYTYSVGGERRRVYTEAYLVPEREFSGWIQVVQSLASLDQSLARLAAQIGIGIPLALTLAGLSGFYLAAYALRPIDRITRTAQSIDATDLAQRIDYGGPADEVGRLASTFDRMLDRLESAFDRQRRFTGDAAHELRTPLAALKARINVVRRQRRQPIEYEEALDDIEGQVERLTRLTRELLFLARLDEGRQRTEQEPIDLGEFISTLLDQIAPVAAQKSITVSHDFSSDITVNGDVDMLIRLFLNLLDNAVTYTPSGGQIDVSTSSEDNMAVIAIRDSGPGIPPEHLSRVFERFYRVETDRSRSGDSRSGTGLGLAIAHEIVQVHGGALIMESAVAEGTTLVVRLPLN